ncbi:MAG TPA: SCO family protein [Euzebyales bacterium]
MTNHLRVRGVLRLLAALTALAAIAGCTPTTTTATLAAADDAAVTAPGWNGVAVDGAPRMPAQSFTAADGRPFDLAAAMRERPTLVYFGYTNCPDMCPVHMANIAAALDETTVDPAQVNVVLVTADPERDTPEVLGEFLETFDRSFIGLWAPREEVDAVLHGLGLPPSTIEEDDDGQGRDGHGYTVGHPSQVFAFDTTGRARLAYPFGTRQSQWVEDLPKLVREWS